MALLSSIFPVVKKITPGKLQNYSLPSAPSLGEVCVAFSPVDHINLYLGSTGILGAELLAEGIGPFLLS